MRITNAVERTALFYTPQLKAEDLNMGLNIICKGNKQRKLDLLSYTSYHNLG